MIWIPILVVVVLLIRYIDYKLEADESAGTMAAKEHGQRCSVQEPNAFPLQ